MLEKRLILALTRCAVVGQLLPAASLLWGCTTDNPQPGTLLFRHDFRSKILRKRLVLHSICHSVTGELRASAVGAFRLCRSGMPSALMSF